jgi:hypothetical protein
MLMNHADILGKIEIVMLIAHANDVPNLSIYFHNDLILIG